MSKCERTVALLVTLVLLACVIGCGNQATRSRIPSEVEAVVASIGDDINQERYDKIYNEASSLWRQDATEQQSTDVLKTLHAKLGKVESRSVHSATEQQNASGPLKGHAFIITYQTKFERGQAMETFTLIEEGGSWKLARYFVSSTELK
jgi:hypothetical protein